MHHTMTVAAPARTVTQRWPAVAVKSDVKTGHDIAYVTRGHASGCTGAMAYYTSWEPQAPEVSDHGLLQKFEDDEEEKDRSNNIQRCTAGVTPSRIPLVTRCRPRCPE